MYSVYSDGICIYSDINILDDAKASNPKLTLADNAAGSLTITLSPSNAGYTAVKRLSSEIIVYREKKEIWSGRVIDEDEDFLKNRTLTCEGELAYLNDTVQPPAEYHDLPVQEFLEKLIAVHNEKSSKQFVVGNVTVTEPNDSVYRYTNYETTLDCIMSILVNRLGGHLHIRKADGVRYLDYLTEYPNTSSQTIQFGQNMLDWTRNWDLTKLATVIVPRGARLEESPIEALEAYTTVESVNEGSIYVKSQEAIEQFGWIEQVVDWDNVTDPAELLKKAQEYLSDAQFEMMVLEISAIDMHYLTRTEEPISLLDQIRCISRPHGMDHVFPVSEMTIPLDNPANTKYTLGTSIRNTMTSSNKQVDDDLLSRLNSMPTKQSILHAAKDRATELINTATTGYITIVKNEAGAEELVISDNMDYTKAQRLWKWNINGLGYSNDGGKTFGLAMTMDGSIVADYVTSGVMSADRVRGGIFEVGGSGFGKDGRILIKDAEDNIVGELDKNGITFNGGSININDVFVVDSNGKLRATSGSFSGNITSSSITSSSMETEMFYTDDEIVQIGGFESRFGWGRDIFQSSDGQCGMSATPRGDGKYWFWAGWQNDSTFDFAVDNNGYVKCEDVYCMASWWEGWSLTEVAEDLWNASGIESDRSLKKNIIPIDKDEALALLLRHTPITFQYKKDGYWSAGFIAQDVEALEDEMGIYYPLVSTNMTSKKYRINYTRYIPLLVASIQNLQEQITMLKEELIPDHEDTDL